MITDPQAAPPSSSRVSALENEIPNYRAISKLSVAGLVLGLFSVFSFINIWFIVASIGAIVAGWLAIRKIARYPDVLTGTQIARFGIGLGLVCGLGASTSTIVHTVLLRSQASRFAQKFTKELKEKDFPTVLWYRELPEARKGKSGLEVLESFQKGFRDPNMFDTEFGELRNCQEDIATRGFEVEYLGLERADFDDLTPYAFALLEVHDHKSNAAPQYALIFAKALVKNGRYDWWVEKFQYPYQRGSMGGPTPKIDDGHGH